MPILIGLGVLAAVVLVLAVAGGSSPPPAPAPSSAVTLVPGAVYVTADQGTSIALALPAGGSWVSLSPVNAGSPNRGRLTQHPRKSADT